MTDEMDHAELVNRCVECGYVARDADGQLDLTAEGRRVFGIPDDKSLLLIGLEALVEEVFDELAVGKAGRPFAARRQ